MRFVRSARLGVAALAVGCSLAAGCAEERDPINQVQVGALPKSFFVGAMLEDASDDPEFYFRTTVVDVAAGAGSEELFTSSDAQPTVRIRWEITETKLIARLAYELIDNTDGTGTNGGARNDEARGPDKAPARTTTDGQIVASFAISKQFDVRRGYNSQTGEENNIVEENDKDRPWNERDYVRVDWSKNLVTDAYDLDAVSQMGLYGVKWDPIDYNVSDPASPDAPAIDLDTGYLDVTNKAFASPQVIHDEEYGDYPACQLVGEYPRISCNTSEVKLRLSFKKVVDTDYEPADWDGRKMELFGYFTSDRYGYDRRYGIIDEKWHRFIARWNVFEKSHDPRKLACATPELTPAGADVHRDLNNNGTEDECEDVGRGSRCDEASHLCTIPLRDRKIKTIPWYVNRDFPEEIFDGGRKVVDTWSDGIRVALLAGRLAECRRTKDADCDAAMGWPALWADDFVPPVGSSSTAEVPHVFVLCHNPVDPAKDDPACGKEGLSPRMGDLRYNFFTYVVSAQAQAPWGIMVDAEDPLTGEKVAGSVNQWGSTLDRAAANLVDLVELINGTTSPDQFIAGKDVSDWVAANQANGTASKPAPMSTAELGQRMGAFDPKSMSAFTTGAPKAHAGPKAAQFRARMKDLEAAGKLGPGNNALTNRVHKLRGTDLEAKLVTPEVAQLAGFNPKEPVSKAGLDMASPLGRMNPMFRRSLERRSMLGRAKRHACRTEAPDGDHLIGLARKAQALFGKVDPKDAAAVKDHRDKIYQWARKEYAVGVFSHEFGHSTGLRHNFAGTFDSLNYDTRYWQLRTNNGKVSKACPPGNTDGASCVGPRYLDPITDDEINGGINGYATSSVMDYPGDQALDMYLMGKYDRAALRMGYGGVVDVWNTPGMSVQGSGDGKQKAYQAIGLTDPPGLFGVRSFPDAEGATSTNIHYSQYAARFGLVDGCRADPEATTLGMTCTGAGLDVVDYRDMKDFAPVPEYASFSTNASSVDPKGRVRRGYMFSSDEFADTGNVPSFRYDAGADPYEQIRFLESAYENRYILDAFRRGRTQFNSEGVVSRIQGHYLDTIQLIAKTFGFAMVLEVDDPSKPDPTLLTDGNYGPLAMGTSVAFDLFTRMLTRPEPGAYCSTGSDQCPGIQPYGLLDYIYVADPYPLPASTPYDFQVALGKGRYIHNDFDYGQGYWWSDYQKQVGSFYDKTWAVYYLSESFDSFISNSKEDFIDGRYKNINFATMYPQQVRRLFGALLTGDIESYAPSADVVAGAGIPGANLTYPNWLLPDGVGTRPAKPKLVDPAFGFNEQLYAMVWGTMLFPTGFSRTFIDDARITALPTEQPSWPAAETYTFIDPATNITYRARTTGTEKIFGVDHQKSIGARMLEWANNLVYEAYVVETDAGGFYLLNADGTPKLKLLNGKPQVNPDVVGGDAALKRYIANIETMRQLVNTFVVPLESALPAP